MEDQADISNILVGMPKSTTIFLCSHCDAQYQKWIGRCLECGQWGTISESAVKKSETEKNKTAAAKTVSLDEIKGENTPRIATGLSELDRVLGGGIVPGSLILLGGEPGIGKSTLALQLATLISPTLYLSGEESVGQIKLRADRLFTKKINFRLKNKLAEVAVRQRPRRTRRFAEKRISGSGGPPKIASDSPFF